MSGYQWMVLFAAWLGWGFDVFDGLLFNYVAPTCVPTLLHLPPSEFPSHSVWSGTEVHGLPFDFKDRAAEHRDGGLP